MKFVDCDCMRVIGNILAAILLSLAIFLFVLALSTEKPIYENPGFVVALGFSFVCFILSNRK